MRQILSTYKWTLAVALLLLFFGGLFLWPKSNAPLNLPDTVDFNYHIRPLLSQNCFVCHGPDESSREAGLRLDNFDSATAKLESGNRAIVPGKPGKSSLLDRIRSQEPDVQMPPPESKKEWTEREIALIERWIAQGAQWKEHWAFIPPEVAEFPAGLEDNSISTSIDYLLEKERKRLGLGVAKQADPNLLIRRIAYLLTGLPPSSEELTDLSKDYTVEKVVDYYLASPHFGERWARHWMDLVRYGESMGHEGDYNISHPWEYRDYLIRAFNNDVPYDLFVKEHLAGDQLKEPRRHLEEQFNESAIGTAYFFLGEGKHSPVNTRLEESDKIDNMIDVTSKTFQGLTVACAKCHDHKFDPIPTTDYYAMYGMIESARLGPKPARRTLKQEQQFEALKQLRQTIKEQLEQQLAQALPPPKAQLIKQQKQFINQQVIDTSYKYLADFRTGTWDGWYTDGWAFGPGPLKDAPIIDPVSKEIVDIGTGKASSRYYAPGIQGVLRSPNFTIEHDFIAVKAKGKEGLIRIIIDNFQVIQAPLWGGLEAVVDESKDIYRLDVRLAQGHKAYLQFMPGHYDGRTHIYRIKPDNYIEVEYAVAYNGEMPELEEKTEETAAYPITTISKNPKLKTLIEQYSELAPQLYDSTHFIGMSEGEAIFSPVFIRGSIEQLSEEKVPHRFLTAVESNIEFPQEGSGRLAFAEAIVDPSNPLTARIMVNRIWHHIFGKGIVPTVDNFGLQGELPSHPELLDYLAIQFIEVGWSIKKMIKHILLSDAFQQSTEIDSTYAEIDPTNRFLHHFPIRRLEAEAIRDGILCVTGELDETLYGPPIPVHLTEYMTGRGRPRASGPLDGAGRRSIYTAVRRNFISPMMLTFDMPIPFTTFGKRNTTNVPAQSLTLMNDPFVKDQASKWAAKLLAREGLTLEDRINKIYKVAFARQAQAEEIAKAKELLEMQAQNFGSSLEQMKDDPQLWASYCHAVFNLKEFIHLL